MTRLSRRTLAFVGLAASFASPLAARAADLISKLDTDKDGTLTLEEAKAGASETFDRLDKDHDGTLDMAELKDRLSPASFRQADADKDGTISKDEYLALVEKRYRAADDDRDALMDARELKTPAGRSFAALLR